MSLREKFWLWATSGARLYVKCCLWAISSLSTALTLSITWIQHTETGIRGHASTWNSVWYFFCFHADVFTTLPRADYCTFPGAMVSHMKSSLSPANSGGLSFTSLTLILARTFVSWWWPPACTHSTEQKPSAFCSAQTYKSVIKVRQSFVSGWISDCLFVCFIMSFWHWVKTHILPKEIACQSASHSACYLLFWFAEITDISFWETKRQPATQLAPAFF